MQRPASPPAPSAPSPVRPPALNKEWLRQMQQQQQEQQQQQGGDDSVREVLIRILDVWWGMCVSENCVASNPTELVLGRHPVP